MTENFTIEKLVRHLRIKEETRKPNAVYHPQVSKVNQVSESNKTRKDKKRKATSEVEDKQDNKEKLQKCFHYGKKGQ